MLNWHFRMVVGPKGENARRPLPGENAASQYENI